MVLRVEALNVLQSVPSHLQQDYDTLVSNMETRYDDEHLQQVYHTQMQNGRQQLCEQQQKFVVEVARLSRLAYAEDFRLQLAVHTFVDSLPDVEIQQSFHFSQNVKWHTQ